MQARMTKSSVLTVSDSSKLVAYLLCKYIAVIGFVFSFSVAASAEELKESFEPDSYVISPGGVNMASGRFRYENVDLNGEAGGLSLLRMSGPPVEAIKSGVIAFDDNPMGQFTHNWNIRVRKFGDNAPGNLEDRHIEIGEKRYAFSPASIPSCPITPPDWVGRTLTRWDLCRIGLGGTNNDRYKYYVTGTEFGRIEFDSGIHGYCRDEDVYCAASKMTRPDGTEFSFEYDVVLSRPRLRRVTSNRGFSLVFLYGSSGALAASPTQICLVNRTIHSLSGSYVCPSGVLKVNYSYSNNTHMSSFTDAVNQVHQYTTTYNPSSHQANRAGYSWNEQYIRPGETSPYLTNVIKRPLGYEETISQTFADGRSITYTWDQSQLPNSPYFYVTGGTYQESGSAAVTVEYARYFDWPAFINGVVQFPADGPTKIVDELGREIVADRCEPVVPNPYAPSPYCQKGGRLQSVTMPEGNRIEYEYSSVAVAAPKPTVTRYVAKPNSGQQNIVQSAGGYNCNIYFLCLSPQFEVDGRGNRTDYVYSNLHGGILSKTGPADAAGIRPQTRYNYVQKNAYVKNGSSYVATQPPIWVLSSEEYCKTTSASGSGCAGGAADEVVMSYDYGPSNGPNNLFLRGTVATADSQSLRTCFTYDANGRKISETQPKGTGSTCP